MDGTELRGEVTHWSHGKARVRLDNGLELPCTPARALFGQLLVGERVVVILSPDATAGRVTARVNETGPAERPRASERRRRATAERTPR